MFYILVFLTIILSIVVLVFIYNKTKSLMFINSFQLIDNVLYKDKLPFGEAIRLKEIGGAKAYFDFHEGELNRISLYMPDNASVYWRVGDKYVTCYDREGNKITQSKFEALYSRFVDAGSILAIFNRNFKKCQLSI